MIDAMVETLVPGGTAHPGRERTKREARPHACLIVAFDAARPFDPPSRHWLSDLDEVSIGRSREAPLGAREASRDGRVLRLRMSDSTVSARHARLRRDAGAWVIEDREIWDAQGRTHGTFVDGLRISQRALSDGSVILLGKTFLVFREVLTADPPASNRLDLGADELATLPRGLQTLSPSLEDQFGELLKIARTQNPIMIIGETGTGKELVARAVHRLSGRKGPLVAVNCGAIPHQLVESHLFGHRKGAFSDAIQDREGQIPASRHGTLFLDEIGELPLSAQPALLRAVQFGEVLPVGEARPIKVDIRVIAATHRDLARSVRDERDRAGQGSFREDLWFRLSVSTVRLPPLRERMEDLGLFLRAVLRDHEAPANTTFSLSAAEAFYAHAWPGNIRELENALLHSLPLAVRGEIDARHQPPELTRAKQSAGAPHQVQRDALVELLRKHKGNLAEVARAEGLTYEAIRKRCERLEVDPKTYRMK
jgi:transcriptional regulator with GAF, ATPase, and Fis domain